MTEAKTILKMIEEVDPADRGGLDEIDVGVAQWLPQEIYDRATKQGRKILSYTRSLDAQKELKREAWHDIRIAKGGGTLCFAYPECKGPMHPDDPLLKTPRLDTEELARLHMAIQLIEYRRLVGDEE